MLVVLLFATAPPLAALAAAPASAIIISQGPPPSGWQGAQTLSQASLAIPDAVASNANGSAFAVVYRDRGAGGSFWNETILINHDGVWGGRGVPYG